MKRPSNKNGFLYGPRRGLVILVLMALVTIAGTRAGYSYLEPGKYTESEKAGFAFHQLSNSIPHYEEWIKNSDAYKNALPEDKIDMIHKGTMRLKNGFYNYMADEDLIKISVKDAEIETSNTLMEGIKTADSTDVTLKLTDLPQSYFPFQAGNIWIAIVVKDFDKVSTKTFTQDEFKDIALKAGMGGSYMKAIPDIKLDLWLRPVSVDSTKPIMLDGIEMWLMLAEIGQMDVWTGSDGTKNIFWSYSAPWYTPETQRELLRLYKN